MSDLAERLVFGLFVTLSATAIVLGVIYLAAFPQRVDAARTTATKTWHSEIVAVTTSSQLIETDQMKRGECVAWRFKNEDTAETVSINLNPDGTDAVAGDHTDQLILGPEESYELQQHRITRFKAIGTGAANLYYQATCYR